MPPPSSLSEPEIVRRLKDGDEEVFSYVVDRYHRVMKAVVSGYLAQAQLQDEVIQETWMAVLTGLPRFEGRSSFKSWLLTILANRARTRATREGRFVPFSALEEGGTELGADRFSANGRWKEPPAVWNEHHPEALLGRSELMERIRELLEQIPSRQRAVLVLRDMEQLTSAEVCEILDLTEANQRVLLHRARTALRIGLEPHLGGAHAHV